MNRTILAKLLVEVSKGRTSPTAALEQIDRSLVEMERKIQHQREVIEAYEEQWVDDNV